MPKPTQLPDSLNFTASLDLQGAKEEGKTPTFSLVANTGIPMEGVMGCYYPVVVDMAGCKFAKGKTPVIADHDTSKRIGHTTEQSIEPSKVLAKGVVSSSMAIARGVVEDAKAGFPFQVSIGASIKKHYFVEEGETTTVNGQTFKGPLVVASKSLIRELSICVLGADGNTSAKIAAQATHNPMESKPMPPELKAFIESFGLDASTLTEEQVANFKGKYEAHKKAADEALNASVSNTQTQPQDLEAQRKERATEELRIAQIKASVSRFPALREVKLGEKAFTPDEFVAHAIGAGMSVTEFELECYKQSLPTADTHGTSHQSQPLFSQKDRLQACEVALLRASGRVPDTSRETPSGQTIGIEAWYPEQVVEASRQLPAYIDLHFLMDETIKASGESFSGSRNSEAFIKAFFQADRTLRAAGLGTHSLANVLSNVANKQLLASYSMQETVWRAICGVKTLNDFKTHYFYRLDESGGYAKVGPDGELGHAALTDASYNVTADTYGQTLVIGRKQLRNDDLGALNDASDALGRNAAICIEETVFGHLLDSRANYVTITSEADLDIDGLTAAEKVFADQVDGVGRPILVSPDRLIVGTQDKLLAKDLYGTRNLLASGVGSTAARNFAENPHVGKYTPFCSPYLNNTSIKRQSDGAVVSANVDANQWFMACNPAVLAAILIGFLDGREAPHFDSDDMPFEYIGGIRFKSYHDFGIGAGNTKGIACSLGTG
jgi:hypothetical protein